MEHLKNLLCRVTQGKRGVEIGGPSQTTGVPIYEQANTIDNVVYSQTTVWADNSTQDYYCNGKKMGTTHIMEATDMSPINDGTYDFAFLSHSLEHIANPIKALYECKRVIADDGYIIIIVPDKTLTFDHNRPDTELMTLVKKYLDGVGEDDLSSLPDILQYHDLALDPPAGDLESFKQRSLQNYTNRCLHHHVFTESLLNVLCYWLDMVEVFTFTEGINIWSIWKKEISIGYRNR